MFALRRPRDAFENDESDSAGEDGFTLIEVIVAFTLLTIVGIAVVYTIINSTRFSNLTKQRVAAGNIARTYIEAARAHADRSEPKGVVSTSTPILVTGTPFSVCQSVALTGAAPAVDSEGCSAPGNTCTSTSTGQTYTVTVTVSWTSNTSNTRQTVRSDTVLAC